MNQVVISFPFEVNRPLWPVGTIQTGFCILQKGQVNLGLFIPPTSVLAVARSNT